MSSANNMCAATAALKAASVEFTNSGEPGVRLVRKQPS